MQFSINGGSFSYGENIILDKVNFTIKDKQKIAVVGRNGCGKTTLLKIISGELELDRDDKVSDTLIKANVGNIGTLKQITFSNENCTLVEEVRKAYSELVDLKIRIEELSAQMQYDHSDKTVRLFSTLQEQFNLLGGYYFEKEYETAIRKFGFTEEDKYKSLSLFSGGQRTKIAFLKLILSKPDILLLDEPTNHLDIESIEWLEDYIKNYSGAVVIVSHDRMFLDKTVQTVFEIEHGHITEYMGDYTAFTVQKKALREQQSKLYAAQQKEIQRLEKIADHFIGKPTKASMAKSKLKAIERITPLEKPENSDNRTFKINVDPEQKSFKQVLSVKDLAIGYNKELSRVTVDVLRGERIGIIGGNGLGKSTFLKTIVGKVPALSGEFTIGRNVDIGYFDQQLAAYNSENTVLSDFSGDFPSLSDTQCRNRLGAFLFTDEDVFKPISKLSGGEKVRLNLCKILNKNPNFLILDEPTNHMDIIGKETLEDILLNFAGTVLFVSHDRYFIKKIATSLLVFEKDRVKYYQYGYEQYLADKIKETTVITQMPTQKREKKSYTTPLKEQAKKERKLKKAEQLITELDEKIEKIKAEINLPENQSDYIKLSDLQNSLDALEEEQLKIMEEWNSLM